MKASTKTTLKTEEKTQHDNKTYTVIRNQPVATFKYKGNHRQPVRRTVIITSCTRDAICGYEVRSGNVRRSTDEKIVKTFSRSKIIDMARYSMNDAKELSLV